MSRRPEVLWTVFVVIIGIAATAVYQGVKALGDAMGWWSLP